jgi:hypothetical protein
MEHTSKIPGDRIRSRDKDVEVQEVVLSLCKHKAEPEQMHVRRSKKLAGYWQGLFHVMAAAQSRPWSSCSTQKLAFRSLARSQLQSYKRTHR